MFVGEIGLSRREFLYDIRFWEAQRILKGYERRSYSLWSAARWQAYHNMIAFCGSENLQKAGINTPRDLMAFPWEKESQQMLSQQEQDDLQADMAAFNKQHKKSD